ncbi:ABC-F type ribosomal protection protein [Caldibacillus lycopersici]|uniref:ABC-F type ribosomal protection protein n=1 Tax=Perspicuibacillus lycopersici TaxID=1325689 RepID=A0AAE3IV36_9BACI|nr:ABC-F type ribosomal protection protein [Perspicuibacillus lycopersici]MCU9615007.1 ABC-F type ribosomal protection protein [Perspicuibacillus lycopersici]
MELCQFHHVSMAFDDKILFQDVTISLQENDVVGLIGANGSGKSTLLQLLQGKWQPTAGMIQWFVPQKLSYVSQEVENVKEMVYTPLHQQWNVPNKPYKELSGGQKLKYRLLHGLQKQSPVLLLDEPTNHLDEKSVARLITEVRKYKGTIVIVSHDRYFLDKVATKIWSIEDTFIYEQQGNYFHYMHVRTERRLAQQRAYEKQQKKIVMIESQLNQLQGWSHVAQRDSTRSENSKVMGAKEYERMSAKRMDKQIKSKRKLLEKQLEKEKVETVSSEPNVLFSFNPVEKRGNRIIVCDQVSVAYGDYTVIEEATFQLRHGEKIAITGPNGSGKTTLLKLLLGRMTPTSGNVWITPSAKIGYLSQTVYDLPFTKTPAQLFERETFKERGKVQTLMKNLGFSTIQWQQPIEKMSMGERIKIKLMQYILEETDLLILDEPTNHLDLPSREQLEETINAYPCTCIIVSHDRYFREKVVDDTLEIHAKVLKRKQVMETMDGNNMERMRLETELQFVLGKLSLLIPNHVDYAVYDKKFNEITEQLKKIKHKGN